MEGRFTGKTIDTTRQLCEEIDYVLAHPDIGGLDCMLAPSVLADPESKHQAMVYGMRGIKVQLTCFEEGQTETHVPTRVQVTPPVKVKAEP